MGRGHFDHRSIPATEQEAHAHFEILHHGRVRRTARLRQRDRFQMGRVESAGEVVVSRGGAGEGVECGASEVVWGESGELED